MASVTGLGVPAKDKAESAFTILETEEPDRT